MNQNRSTEIHANSVPPKSVHPSSSAAESTVSAAIDTLKMGDFQARWEVSKLLSKSGTAAIEPLLNILEEEDTDWELLWFVARIFGNIEHASAISALVNLVATTNHEDVAGMATAALTHHGTAAIAPLTNLLHQDTARLFAVKALAQIRHPDAIPPLLTLVTDPTPAIRTAAIEALSHVYTAGIAMILLTALEDTDASVRKAAVIGLGIQASQMDTADWVKPLQERLRDLHLDVCCQAAIALGRIGTNQAADALFEVLQSPHTPVALQLESVRALARMDTADALARLHTLLKQSGFEQSWEQSIPTADSESTSARVATCRAPEVQQEIFTMLGRIESPETQDQAAQILLNCLQSSTQVLTLKHKQTIALSLAQLRLAQPEQQQAIEALIHLLADTNASVRFHAIAALKQLDFQQSHQRLCEYASRSDLDESLKHGVTIALQEWTI